MTAWSKSRVFAIAANKESCLADDRFLTDKQQMMAQGMNLTEFQGVSGKAIANLDSEFNDIRPKTSSQALLNNRQWVRREIARIPV